MASGASTARRSAPSVWFLVAIVVSALSVAACGDDDPDQAPAPTAAAPLPRVGLPEGLQNPRTAVNRAPLIGGKPLNAVLYGATYAFEPTAHDPEGVSLAFRIANRPAWASFDPSTGKLRGAPGMADIGSYQGIAITVTDGMYETSLPPFGVDVVGTATGSIVVSWAAPTERLDGSAFTDLAGYKLYWGLSRGNYSNHATISHPGIAAFVIEPVTAGTYYVVATAYDSKGVESGFSRVFSKTVL